MSRRMTKYVVLVKSPEVPVDGDIHGTWSSREAAQQFAERAELVDDVFAIVMPLRGKLVRDLAWTGGVS